MEYSKAIVKLSLKAGRGTIAIMQWIRDNNYPELELTDFQDCFGESFAIVSSYPQNHYLNNALETGTLKWHEVSPGFKRIGMFNGCWIVNVDGYQYIITA